MSSRPQPLQPQPARPQRLPLILILVAVIFLVQLACTLPGELIADSREQLRQAIARQYTDWHPPVMALVWSWLIRLGGTAGSLLALHQFLHWVGIGLIADGCYRAGRRAQAFLVLAAGAFPLLLFYDRIVLKDVGMASALVAATGIIAWFVFQDRRIPPWALLLAGLCLAYGTLVRTNAVFAMGPLLLLYSARGRRLGLVAIVAWSVLAALVAVPLSNWVNHGLIGSKPEYPIQSLQIFDLMGIAAHSHDNRVFGDHPPAMSDVRACYTSYWWDPVSPWGSCPQLRLQLGYSLDAKSTSPASVANTSKLWRAAIASHPVAYVAHRLNYFNSSIYFIVPALQFRFSKSVELAPIGERSITQQDIDFDYLKINPLCWPVVWLAMGACALALLGRSTGAPAQVAVARLLIISALLFSGAYLLVGVATDIRYYYWPIMAILLGVTLAWREIAHAARQRPWTARLAGGILLLIIVAGYAARIADVRFV